MDISEKMADSNRKTMETTKVGSLRYDFEQKDGASFQSILQNVRFVLELWIIFSFSIIKNDGLMIKFTRGTSILVLTRS
jgi:hypothetical protein